MVGVLGLDVSLLTLSHPISATIRLPVGLRKEQALPHLHPLLLLAAASRH